MKVGNGFRFLFSFLEDLVSVLSNECNLVEVLDGLHRNCMMK